MKSIKLLPLLVFASVLGVNSSVLAQDALLEQINNYSQEDQDNTQSQVTSVSQLRDVSPGDWAFEALRNLVERYGCISGYPDRTFRGNQPLTRYEFAAGLNSCLQQIERLIGTGGDRGGVDQESLTQVQKLTEEFKGELAALGVRVDNLEAKLGKLEKQQFSTTTKLGGEVVLGLASPLSGDVEKNPVLGHRTRLDLITSFTGEDELFTRLATGNFPDYGEFTGFPSTNLAFSQPDDNDLALEALLYTFPLGKNISILVAGNGGAGDDLATPINPLYGDGGSGSLSAFGNLNPIYYAVEGAGLGIKTNLGEKLELNAGYLAKDHNDPSPGAGLFDGAYNVLGQLVFKPSEKFNLGLTYIYGYNSQDTGVGSVNSNFQDVTGPITSNSYGVELSWQLTDQFVIGGWGGYTNSQILDGDKGSVDVWNWAATLGLKDLGKEGNLAGLIVGMQPKVTDSSNINVAKDRDTSLHFEAFYQYQLNDNIAITPGVIWLTSPDHNKDNEDIVIGTIRTTFSF
jgi:Carbohydrate-selective porin, OprB family/S-layer homology domain